MKIFALFLAIAGCAAASSEEKGKPLEVEMRHGFVAPAATNDNARGGLTVLRRMTTATQVSVSTESEFNAAIGTNIVIELTDDIILTATIDILPQYTGQYTGLVINGNGKKVDGQTYRRCFYISNKAEVSFNDLTITNGKDNGGGFYIIDATVSFTSCTLSSNKAPNFGGALFIDNAIVSFTLCTLSTNEAGDGGGAVYLNRATASFTLCTFSTNEAGGGGVFYFDNQVTLDLIGCTFFDNTAPVTPSGGDIMIQGSGGTLNLYSLCPVASKYAGTGSLDCYGCSGPADLSDASACTECDSGTYSCCGATECSASEASCSTTYEEAMCPASTSAPDPSGTCFHGATQVTLEDKSTKAMTELQVGDKIQTADIRGNLAFAPIISLPHKAGNSEMATFLKISTDSGKSVQMTPGHLIPNCAGKMFSANEVALGDCVMTVDGKEAVSEITSATHFGVYTAVTAHALIVANGIVASSFSVENDPHHHKDNDGISSSFVYFLNKLSGKVSTGLRGAKEPSNS